MKEFNLNYSPEFIVIDLFCGAGGTSTGFDMTNGIAVVAACVNHDAKAIKSHWRNYPEVEHFEEDITKLYKSESFTRLIRVVNIYRAFYPNAKIILWASLECTNFSRAKGGLPRDADSRTLAEHLQFYIAGLNPDYVQIENVVEFMSWGPLDEKGKPVSKKNGQDFLRWREEICSLGFYDDWKEMNSANYGAYTSRNRLFGIFARPDLPIAWPEASHAKNPSKLSMFGNLHKWKPVKDVLDFSDEGKSIFGRNKDLTEKTLERIYAGLLKYVAKGDTSFISKYYSGKPDRKNITIDGPAGTVTTIDSQSLIQADFLLKYNSTNGNTGKHVPPSLEDPAPVVSCQGRLGLVQPQFLSAYYGNGDNVSSVDSPAPTLPTKDRCALVQPQFLLNYNHSSNVNDINQAAPTLLTRDKLAIVKPEYFIDKQYSGNGNCANHQSIDEPSGAILANDKHSLIEVSPFIMPTNYDNGPKSIDEPSPTITANRKHHYLVNPAWGGNPGNIDQPCCVIVARQDKAPLYFVQVEEGAVSIAVYEADSACTIKIKQFMAAYGLVDVKMRMLRVNELLKIQGFPSDYKLEGNQSDQKKFIGNSVVPHVVKAWTEALAGKLNLLKSKAA